MLRIGIIAGEVSGDYLGANLIKNIRRKTPDVVVEGIGGPKMEMEGCRLIFPMEKLSVMGFVEVLGKYIELRGIRNRITEYFIQHPPDVFIGVDAPDFNLDLEKKLRAHNIKTVHYVSPQVWAWREYRLAKISQAVDMILALFPFEEGFYNRHNIPVTYVGHPLADQIALSSDQAAARRRLGLPSAKKIVAIMPGSRRMELNRLLKPFLLTATWCLEQDSELHFISSLTTKDFKNIFLDTVSKMSLNQLPLTVYEDCAHDVLEAADVVLVACGTITLETMLFKRPMVVAYKVNWLTYYLIKALIKVDYAALPNLLAGMEIVPEFLQQDCRPERLGQEIMKLLKDTSIFNEVENKFLELHNILKLDAGKTAAKAVLELVGT